MIPITKNFIFYDSNRKPLAFPAEHYGDAIQRNLDGTEKRITLPQSQIDDLNNGRSLNDPSIIPLAKYGLVAETINIESIGQEVFTNTSDSQSYVSVERAHKNSRPDITVTFKLIARDWTDFSLKENRYRAWLNSLEQFYVADARQPFKLYKVMIDGAFKFEQPHYRVPVGEADITLKKIDSIFAESLHTTQDIDNEGVRFNDKWAYGMGLSSQPDQWKYTFENENPRFYNAGTDDIKLIRQKESVITLIARESTNAIHIVDDNNTALVLDANVQSGMALRLSGSKITLANNNVLHRTNANFLTVNKGWNNWEIRGLNKFEFRIDFRFLYD